MRAGEPLRRSSGSCKGMCELIFSRVENGKRTLWDWISRKKREGKVTPLFSLHQGVSLSGIYLPTIEILLQLLHSVIFFNLQLRKVEQLPAIVQELCSLCVQVYHLRLWYQHVGLSFEEDSLYFLSCPGIWLLDINKSTWLSSLCLDTAHRLVFNNKETSNRRALIIRSKFLAYSSKLR